MIRFLCVLALVLLSFAHRPVDVSTPLLQISAADSTTAEPVFIRYKTLPDGNIISICISGNRADGDNQHNQHHFMADCEACRISASFMLVTPPAVGGPIVARDHNNAGRQIVLALPRSNLYPPSAPPQAPPVLA
ncbi:hypothetical protein [Pseudochrobactrum sp. HB0163]|uniref:hypothetical protein n=1 Tax=Pseudochrobactrum sp. HB0163 TaxID=3450708 RepID=UPI003F6E231E